VIEKVRGLEVRGLKSFALTKKKEKEKKREKVVQNNL